MKKTLTVLLLVLLTLGLFISCNGDVNEKIFSNSYKVQADGSWKMGSNVYAPSTKPYILVLPKTLNVEKDVQLADLQKGLVPLDGFTKDEEVELGKAKITLTTALSADNEEVLFYEYINDSEEAQNIYMKTHDDYSETILLDAPKDEFSHYGSLNVATVDAVAGNSYYEYGYVKQIILKLGHLLVKSQADVKSIIVAEDANPAKVSIEIESPKVEEVRIPARMKEQILSKSNIPQVIVKEAKSWLCFTAEEASSSVKLTTQGSPETVTLETSTDGETWTPYSLGTEISLSKVGDNVYVRAGNGGTNNHFSKSMSDYYQFVMTGKVAASGNVMSLVDASCNSVAIPNTYCFKSLFENCTSLTSAPALPASQLKEGCYSCMFKGCSALKKAPTLAASKLAKDCYASMFEKCTSLTKAELPATTLTEGCYKAMFSGCTKLNKLTVAFTEWNPESATTEWLKNVAQNGTFVCSSELQVSGTVTTGSDSKVPNGWTVVNTDKQQQPQPQPQPQGDSYTVTFDVNGKGTAPASQTIEKNGKVVKPADPTATDPIYMFLSWFKDEAYTQAWDFDKDTVTEDTILYAKWTFPLCFTAEKAGATVKLTVPKFDPNNPIALDYSKDGSTWTNYEIDTAIQTTNVGDKVYFRANTFNNTFSDDHYAYYKFVIDKTMSCSGNVMYLLDPNGELNSLKEIEGSVFYGLFSGTPITTAPELPAMYLANGCYESMFQDCTSLTKAPELPATTLAIDCYSGMFKGCTSLTKAPELPATEMKVNCYCSMFEDCTSLTTAPALTATTLAKGCYYSMFLGCTDLTAAPALPAMTLAEECYNGMFQGCTSLTTAPVLRATDLERWCYQQIFKDCIKLSSVTMLAGNISDDFLPNWLTGVATTGTLYVDSSMINALIAGSNGIPEGWTVSVYTK